MITCHEVVELLLEFTSDELGSERQEYIENHLRLCTSCHAYWESYRLTIQIARELRPTSLPLELASRLLAVLKESQPPHPRE